MITALRKNRGFHRRQRSTSKTKFIITQQHSEDLANHLLMSKIKELHKEKEGLEIEQYQQARLYRKQQEVLREASQGELLKRRMGEDMNEWRRNISTMEKTVNKLQRKSKRATQENNRLSTTSRYLEEMVMNKDLKETDVDTLQQDICLHTTMIANQDHIIKNLRKELRMLNKRYDKNSQKVMRKTNKTKEKTVSLQKECQQYKDHIVRLERVQANRSIYCQQPQRALLERRRKRLALPAPKARLALQWRQKNGNVVDGDQCLVDEITDWLKDIQITPNPRQQFFKMKFYEICIFI